MQIVQYTTEEEANQIISEKEAQGLILIEIANITEGNFLGFAENPNEIPKNPENPVKILQKIVQEQQEQIDQLTIILGDTLLNGGV